MSEYAGDAKRFGREVGRMKIKKLLVLCMCVFLSLSSTVSFGYSEKASGNGRHPHHLHENGVCPHSNHTKPSCRRDSALCYRTSTVKRVQKRLNRLGYKCGRTNGY